MYDGGKRATKMRAKGKNQHRKAAQKSREGERPAHGVFVTADVCTMHSPSVKKGDRKKGDERGI